MKIYELQWNEQDEKEWIAANTVIEALIFYSELTGTSLIDWDEVDDIIEVPEEKWEELTVRNTDYDVNDPNDWESKSFKEFMKDCTKPEIIAGTMYDQKHGCLYAKIKAMLYILCQQQISANVSKHDFCMRIVTKVLREQLTASYWLTLSIGVVADLIERI